MQQITNSALHFLVFGLIFFLGATMVCGQPAGWQGKTVNREGVGYIHNPEQGIWDTDPTKMLKVEKIFSIGKLDAKEEYLFSWVQDITTDTADNIYACDSREHRIQVYDISGKYLHTIGEKGQGPGELMRPQRVRIGQKGEIYILDSRNHRISIFNSDGAFDSSFQYDGYCGDMEIDATGQVLLIILRFGKQSINHGSIVTVVDHNGKILQEYGEPKLILENDGHGRPRYAFNNFAMRYDGTLIVHFSYPYLLHFYENGRLKAVVTRESPIFMKPEIVETLFKPVGASPEKMRTVQQRAYIWQTFPLPDGRFFTFIRDAGNNYRESSNERDFETYLDVFDRNGYFLKSCNWDWRQYGLIKHVDAEGYFYSNFGETAIVPGVTKYRVGFN